MKFLMRMSKDIDMTYLGCRSSPCCSKSLGGKNYLDCLNHSFFTKFNLIRKFGIAKKRDSSNVSGALISSYTRGEQNESHLQLAVFLLNLMHNGSFSFLWIPLQKYPMYPLNLKTVLRKALILF